MRYQKLYILTKLTTDSFEIQRAIGHILTLSQIKRAYKPEVLFADYL